jgi:hypothetical protein
MAAHASYGRCARLVSSKGLPMAERMYVGSAGTLKFDEYNKPYVTANEGQSGNVLYGRSERYVEKGKYEVTFESLIENLFTKDGRNFCHVDVVHSIDKEHTVLSLELLSIITLQSTMT